MLRSLRITSTPLFRSLRWAHRPRTNHSTVTRQAVALPPRTSGARFRIWFRHDGTARSKTLGLLAVAHLTFGIWGTFKLFKMKPLFLTTLAQVQRVDGDYAATSFDSYRATLDYCMRLCDALIYPATSTDSEPLFRAVAALENDAERRQAAHRMMRQAADTVHDILVIANMGLAPADWDAKGKQTAMQTASRMWVQSRVYAAILPFVRALHELTIEAHNEQVLHEELAAAAGREALVAKDTEKSHQVLG
ncbi:hypothetical protein C8R47DRAFT_552687 [Mycena vitilis]|nr:hypothetical protein C8R47DRAFT_552687 [Mycena vitilis]